MIDIEALKREAADLRSQGYSSRQIASRLAEIVFMRYRERPTQALIMDVLWDREAGKRPSSSTIHAGLRDFIAREAALRERALLGPETWPEDMRCEASELLAAIDRWARRQAEQEIERVRAEADRAIDAANRKHEEALRDLEIARARSQELEARLTAVEQARDEAMQQHAAASARLQEAEEAVARLDSEKTLMAERIDAMQREHAHKVDQMQAEISTLGQLLTASQESVKRLKVEVQQEIDRSESLRKELEAVAQERADAIARAQASAERITSLEAKVAEMVRMLDRFVERDKRMRARHRPSMFRR